MGKRTLISFVTHADAEQFDLMEYRSTSPLKRLEILARLIELQKELPKHSIFQEDAGEMPIIRRMKK